MSESRPFRHAQGELTYSDLTAKNNLVNGGAAHPVTPRDNNGAIEWPEHKQSCTDVSRALLATEM